MVDLEQYETLSNYIEGEILPKLDDEGMKAHDVRVLILRDLRKHLEHDEDAAEAPKSNVNINQIMELAQEQIELATDELESAIIGKMRLYVKCDYTTKEIVCIHTTKEGECSKCKAKYKPTGGFFSIVNDNPYKENKD